MVILYMSFLCRLVLSLPIMYYVFICNYFYDLFFFFFSSRRRHTRCSRDWSSDVCSSDLRWRARSSRSARSIGSVTLLSALVEAHPQLLEPERHIGGGVVVAPLAAAGPEVGHTVDKSPERDAQIGRASCRERVERAGVGEA